MTKNEQNQTIIKYDYNDIIGFIKANASRVLNLSVHEITEDMIQITPDAIKKIDITVSHTKLVNS